MRALGKTDDGVDRFPLFKCQSFPLGEEIICGNRHEKGNPLHWDQVQLNLPGSLIYNPTIAWGGMHCNYETCGFIVESSWSTRSSSKN
eukprot:2630708-Ditylum_brightwellii.AAC.1